MVPGKVAPTQKRGLRVTDREHVIDELSRELNRLNWDGDSVRAMDVAQQLEQVLGEPTSDNLDENLYSWILIAEAHGDIAKAIQLQDAEIVRLRSEFALGGYDAYPVALRKDVEYLQDCLDLQAERYLKVGDREKAKACVLEIYSLADKYGIGPTEDARTLFNLLVNDEG